MKGFGKALAWGDRAGVKESSAGGFITEQYQKKNISVEISAFPTIFLSREGVPGTRLLADGAAGDPPPPSGNLFCDKYPGAAPGTGETNLIEARLRK